MARNRRRSMDPKSLANDVERILDLATANPTAGDKATIRLLFEVIEAATNPKVVTALAPLNPRNRSGR